LGLQAQLPTKAADSEPRLHQAGRAATAHRHTRCKRLPRVAELGSGNRAGAGLLDQPPHHRRVTTVVWLALLLAPFGSGCSARTLPMVVKLPRAFARTVITTVACWPGFSAPSEQAIESRRVNPA